jgi:hypothetical protein
MAHSAVVRARGPVVRSVERPDAERGTDTEERPAAERWSIATETKRPRSREHLPPLRLASLAPGPIRKSARDRHSLHRPETTRMAG